MNKTCKIAGIRNLLERNYKIQTDTIDLDSLVDETLTFSENWKKIKDEYVNETFCPCCHQIIR